MKNSISLSKISTRFSRKDNSISVFTSDLTTALTRITLDSLCLIRWQIKTLRISHYKIRNWFYQIIFMISNHININWTLFNINIVSISFVRSNIIIPFDIPFKFKFYFVAPSYYGIVLINLYMLKKMLAPSFPPPRFEARCRPKIFYFFILKTLKF